MKLLLDEMMDPAVAAGLQARGHDVIAVRGAVLRCEQAVARAVV